MGTQEFVEQLRKQYEELFAIFESIEGGMYVADMDTYEILYINRHIRDLYGDVVGKRCWEMIQEGMNGPCPFCTNDRLLDAQGKPVEPVVWEHHNARTGRWYQCVDRAIRWPGGRFVRMEIAFDITERMRVEDALRESEEKYRDFFSNAQVGLFWSRISDGKLLECNDLFSRLVGYHNREECLAEYIFSEHYVDPDVRSQMLVEIRNQGEIQNFEAQLTRRDGSPIWVSYSAHIYPERGRIAGVIVDITERVRLEKEARLQQKQLMQADKMVALGTLVSGIGHEINNPNNFILLNIPLLKGVWESALPVLEQYVQEHGDVRLRGISFREARRMVPQLFDDILEGARRIKRIVEELKNYARPQEASPDEWVDVNEVVRSAIMLSKAFIHRRTQNFSAEYGDNLPRIRGSAQRIEQVVINLVQNACEALQDNQESVSITTSYDEEQKGVVIAMRDEGVGIPEENLKHITDPFFTTRRSSGGSGLGLSISDHIVQDHRGTLSFRSTPGEGTMVTVFLPFEDKDEEES